MVAKWIAMGLGAVFLAFVAVFMSAGLRGTEPVRSAGDRTGPVAMLSEQLSDGRIEAQVFSPGNRDVRLELQFIPNADSTVPAGMRPEAVFAMENMHMDGFDPPLESIRPGAWISTFKLPMAGRWIVSVGFGEEFAEVEFDAQ